MKFLFIVTILFCFYGAGYCQQLKVIAEELSVYDDSLKGFESSGEGLVAVTFDKGNKMIMVSYGEFNTNRYEVYSIEEKDVNGEKIAYWNLRDAIYLRVAIVPDMIMFINRDGQKGMVLTKLTYLSPD